MGRSSARDSGGGTGFGIEIGGSSARARRISTGTSPGPDDRPAEPVAGLLGEHQGGPARHPVEPESARVDR